MLLPFNFSSFKSQLLRKKDGKEKTPSIGWKGEPVAVHVREELQSHLEKEQPL